MFGKKSTHAEPVWDPHMLAVLDRIETRLDRLEALVRATQVPAREEKVPTNPGAGVREWLPVLDRFHELTLVAMGHPDLAQSFGLTSRQQAATPEPTTEWVSPKDEEGGTVYG
jgi:hypothetical protein